MLEDDTPALAAAAAAAESSATLTEAFTYVPSPQTQDEVQTEAMPALEPPYAFGYFVSVVFMFFGLAGVSWGVALMTNPELRGIGALLLIFYALLFVLGLGLLKKIRFAMRILIWLCWLLTGMYGLVMIGNMLFYYDPGSIVPGVIGMALNTVVISYYNNRL